MRFFIVYTVIIRTDKFHALRKRVFDGKAFCLLCRIFKADRIYQFRTGFYYKSVYIFTLLVRHGLYRVWHYRILGFVGFRILGFIGIRGRRRTSVGLHHRAVNGLYNSFVGNEIIFTLLQHQHCKPNRIHLSGLHGTLKCHQTGFFIINAIIFSRHKFCPLRHLIRNRKMFRFTGRVFITDLKDQLFPRIHRMAIDIITDFRRYFFLRIRNHRIDHLVRLDFPRILRV